MQPEEDRLTRGREMLSRLSPEAGTALVESLRTIAPELENLLLGFVFADVYSREVIPLRERQIIRLAALTALGAGHSPLKANVEAAVRIGIPPEDIVEVFLQVLPYAGFPRVLTALETVKEVLDPPGGADGN